jgi:hypothetical protein
VLYQSSFSHWAARRQSRRHERSFMDQTHPLSSTVAILIGTASKRSQVINLKQPWIVVTVTSLRQAPGPVVNGSANGASSALIDKQAATSDQRAPSAGPQCKIREFEELERE